MRAMLLTKLGEFTADSAPLALADLPIPTPQAGEVLLQVSVCGVCHTELDEIEGRLPPLTLPMVLGHQAVGRVVALGPDTHHPQLGSRVGVAWIYSACGVCEWCRTDRENLCPMFRATGRDVHGGYAEYMRVPAAYTYALPEFLDDAEVAPLLCAGAIGYRSLRLAQLTDGQSLGLTGFGASAHLVLKMVQQRCPHTAVYVFARSPVEQAFARELGATWAGDTHSIAPVALNAIIDTTPVWTPIVAALRNLAPGGRLVINAIRKESSDQNVLLQLSYPDHLWREKEIKTVANVTRRDVQEFLRLAAEIPLRPTLQVFPLTAANQVLAELRAGQIRGAKVLQIST